MTDSKMTRQERFPKNWLNGDVLRDEEQAGLSSLWAYKTNIDYTIQVEVARRLGTGANRKWNDPRGDDYYAWVDTLNI